LLAEHLLVLSVHKCSPRPLVKSSVEGEWELRGGACVAFDLLLADKTY